MPTGSIVSGFNRKFVLFKKTLQFVAAEIAKVTEACWEPLFLTYNICVVALLIVSKSVCVKLYSVVAEASLKAWTKVNEGLALKG